MYLRKEGERYSAIINRVPRRVHEKELVVCHPVMIFILYILSDILREQVDHSQEGFLHKRTLSRMIATSQMRANSI